MHGSHMQWIYRTDLMYLPGGVFYRPQPFICSQSILKIIEMPLLFFIFEICPYEIIAHGGLAPWKKA